ncbi:hypothetical protein cyc_04363 [Cyclospora cayetanensis]|uniref:Uncharacterized protein n=1 Tax=Cyclospora cayetanensis TaxID=88456 RepID=A0A1D3CU37_9EIME|nr:hypothetical protein cyc_04363 [Cyclospora cayetanensis]
MTDELNLRTFSNASRARSPNRIKASRSQKKHDNSPFATLYPVLRYFYHVAHGVIRVLASTARFKRNRAEGMIGKNDLRIYR